MKIEPSGVIFTDICSVQTERCEAKKAAPITAVWTFPARLQVNVCRPCLEEQVRSGEWEIPGAKIEKRADIAVYSPDNGIQLIVEIKKKPQQIENPKLWATTIYRNLLMHGGIPNVPYFMLVVPPEFIFLWKRDNYLPHWLAPNYEIAANNIFAEYVAKVSIPPDIKDEKYYTMYVVHYWLKELTKSKPSIDDPSYKWLYASGLAEAITNGVIYVQAIIGV